MNNVNNQRPQKKAHLTLHLLELRRVDLLFSNSSMKKGSELCSGIILPYILLVIKKMVLFFINLLMARTKRAERRVGSAHELASQMAVEHVELCERYSSKVDMPIHGTAKYYTELYGLDEDQASSYHSQNNGSDGKAKDEGLDARSMNGDIMQDDRNFAEVEAEWLRICKDQGNDVASIEDIDVSSQGKLSYEEKRH